MLTVSKRTALKVIYWNAAAAVMVVCLAAASITRRLHAYDTLIVRVSRARGLDPRLVSAVIWTESRFRPERVGKKGEIGLMQVTGAAAQEWAADRGVASFSKNDLFNPETNIRAGTWYLARAIRTWSVHPDPLPYALAEYNAGHSNAERWSAEAGADARVFWEAITYPTTKRYVRDILTRYRGGV